MAAKQAPQVPPTERVQTSYKQLSLAAINLNNASDELGKAISVLDAALKKLNLGISAWVEMTGSDNGLNWWSRSIGYTKVGDKWGIALKDARGHFQHPEIDSEQTWLFSDGPRWMRTEAVGHIPDLLEALAKQAEDTTKKVEKRTARAYDLASAINEAASQDLRMRLRCALSEAGQYAIVDALQHTKLTESDSGLTFSTTSDEDLVHLKSPEFAEALRRLVGQSVKFTAEWEEPF